MALLKNCEIHFAKVDPKHPNAKFNKENPTWELQLRTTDPEQKKEWEGYSLKPKLMVYKAGEENEGEPILSENGKKQWRVNLQKKSITQKGEPSSAVQVVNYEMKDVDPNSIGNGSTANVRIYQYNYDNGGKKGVASVLMGIQLINHIVYVAKPREDDFGETEGQTIVPESNETAGF